MCGRRRAGRRGRRVEVGTRRVAFEETLRYVHESCGVGVVVGKFEGAHLLTFWPPGPLERLKEIWQMVRGIVVGDRFESQVRAADRSASSAGAPCLAAA